MPARHWWFTIVAGLGFAGLYAGAVLWEPGQRLDDEVFGRVLQLGDGPVSTVLPGVARRLLPLALIVAVVMCAVGVRRHRGGRQIGAAAVLVVGSVVISRLLREPVLWRPVHGEGYGYPANTFPSTHMTLVMALVVALWLLVRQRPVWLAPVLGLVVLVAMVGNVVGHAHRPSDTLGSVLLVGAMTGVAYGIKRRSDPAAR